MGTAIAVQIEELDPNGKPYAVPRIENYLLTCGHVIRGNASDGTPGWGPVLEEICCWPAGRGYARTRADGRKSGSHPGVYFASVSSWSPCNAAPGELPANERNDSDDWVLLKISDPRFRAVEVVNNWGDVGSDSRLKIIGYPNGAGFLASAGLSGHHFWESGDIIEPYTGDSFSKHRSAAPGLMNLDGSDETRRGMSGGGVFDQNGILVGIHRSADDGALKRSSITAKHVFDWLAARRRRVVGGFTNTGSPPLSVPPQTLTPELINRPVVGELPKIPFVNRSKLRGMVRDLTADHSEYRLMCLKGERGTGKTHSWHFIKCIANSCGVTPVFLDLSQSLQAEEVCRSIARQMKVSESLRAGMERSVLVDRPAEERIGKKFAEWLVEAAQNPPSRKWWLVFDGIATANQLREDIVDHLLTRLQTEHTFTAIIPILLGYERPWDPIFKPFVLCDDLLALTRKDVEDFVNDYARLINRSLRPDEKAQIVKSIVGDWTGPFTPEQMCKLYDNARVVVKEVLI